MIYLDILLLCVGLGLRFSVKLQAILLRQRADLLSSPYVITWWMITAWACILVGAYRLAAFLFYAVLLFHQVWLHQP